MKKHIPNILTVGRVVLCLVNFLALSLIPAVFETHRGNQLEAMAEFGQIQLLARLALGTFIIAAVTDFFDGWLARRWGVTSTFGAILDPIADKILVCGGILGLLGLGARGVLLPGALILFREFAVSAMREVLAPRGIKLPVTFLAKTKTTLQLVALTYVMVLTLWTPLTDAEMDAPPPLVVSGGMVFIWLAALVTVWTGVEYALAARKALKAQSA